MSEELEINGEQFLPSKVAAKQVGYTGDYVARLAREEKVRARKIGKTWFVSIDSLTSFAKQAEAEKDRKRQELSEERRQELKAVSKKRDQNATSARRVYIPKLSRFTPSSKEQPSAIGKTHALAETLTVLMLGIFFGTSGYLISSSAVAGSTPSGVDFLESLAISVYETLTPEEQESAPTDAALVDRSQAEPNDTPQEVRTGHVQFVRSDEVSTITAGEDDQLRMEAEAERAIKESFSDKVEIAFDDSRPNAAVVFPVFADGRGEPYEFVIMPMPKHENAALTASSSEDNDEQN